MTQRTEYQGSILVYVEAHGRFYVFKWNGRKYEIHTVADYIKGKDGELLSPGTITNSMPEVDFRISEKDLEILANIDFPM